MAAYKEIVTKAVVGKGKKYFKNTYTLAADVKPSTVLGCWVINHKFKGTKNGDKVGINGSFDANIWYSHDDDTKTNVISKKIDYKELLNVKSKSDANLSGDFDILVRCLKNPNCTRVLVNDKGEIEFDIEKEMGIELVGETKDKIVDENDEEPWDLIEDDVTEEIEKEIDKVNEDFI